MTQPTTEDLFDGPGSASSIKWTDHNGQLVLVWPIAVKPFTFQDGKTGDVTDARVVVLDPPGGQPVEYAQTVIFPKRLQGQVRGNIGRNKPNLGRVAQQPEPGKNPSWIITEPTEQDKQLAMRFLTGQITARPAEMATMQQGQPAMGVAGVQQQAWTGNNQAPPF